MVFDLSKLILNQYFLTFVTLFFGMLLGNWKRMGSLRLGVGGPMFVGIIIGWAVYRYAVSVPEGAAAYGDAQTLIQNNVVQSSLQTVLLIVFIAAMGLSASRDLRYILKQNGVKFIVMGLIITFFGAAVSFGSSLLLPDTNRYSASGLYTGALTSSPGLGSAIELSGTHARTQGERFSRLDDAQRQELLLRIDPDGGLPADAEALTDEQLSTLAVAAGADVGTAYAISYPFGMISVILGIMLLPKLFGIDPQKELSSHRATIASMKKHDHREVEEGGFDIVAFALVCVTGLLIGAVEIKIGAVGSFGLGTSGGVLLSSVLFGYFGKLGPLRFRIKNESLAPLRDFSVSAYLGMVGLSYGDRVVQALAGSGLMYAITSLLIGLICVFAAFLIGRYGFKMNWVLLAGVISGSMTSTPGLGVACNALDCDDPGAGYAATYPSALLGMVLFTILMYNI